MALKVWNFSYYIFIREGFRLVGSARDKGRKLINVRLLIANDSDYLRKLRENPDVTLAERLQNIRPYDVILRGESSRVELLGQRPDYIQELIQRPVEVYRFFQANQKPVISDLSGDHGIYVHASAGGYEIQLLKLYLIVQNSLETYRPKIQVKA